MPVRPLRFLFAARALLDGPLRNPGTLSASQRETVDVATLVAWDRLLEFSRELEIDAVILAGNTWDSQVVSLAAEASLVRGLELLSEAGIPVVIVPGSRDPISAWQDLPQLPDGVHVIDSKMEPLALSDQGKTIAVLAPLSAHATSPPREYDRYRNQQVSLIGVLVPGNSTVASSAFSQFQDWTCIVGDADLAPRELLSSRKQDPTLVDGRMVWLKPTQGLSRDEAGMMGATLIEISPDQPASFQSRFVPLSSVRWEFIAPLTTDLFSSQQLFERFVVDFEKLRDYPEEQLRLVFWRISWDEACRLEVLDDRRAKDLFDQLTQHTDRPKSVRTVHHLVVDDAPGGRPSDGELLEDYLSTLKDRFPVNFKTVAEESRKKSKLPMAWWDEGERSADNGTVETLARNIGRKWFHIDTRGGHR